MSTDQATKVAAGLACLDTGRYSEGDDAMMLAEQDRPPRAELGNAAAVEQLVARHEQLVRAKGAIWLLVSFVSGRFGSWRASPKASRSRGHSRRESADFRLSFAT